MRILRPFVLGLLLVGISGCASKELSRAKALELLKAGSADLLSDAVWDGALYWWRFDHFDGPSPDDCESLKKVAFAERLATMKTIKGTMASSPPSPPHSGRSDYAFWVLDPTFAKSQGRRGAQPVGEAIDLVMGKATLGEVTGIKEDGTSAIAEASIRFEPTPIFQALADTEAAFAKKGQQCDPLYQLPGAQTKSFRFERFDDGWRLKGKLMVRGGARPDGRSTSGTGG
ncbi:MAG TPA: hypothetical protein VGS22_29200 [Thermoanaerobaculia bacterium]|jgi:hypothetical protein|nr:hypothetical protein [Thermoanaerobaculia bacterium]